MANNIFKKKEITLDTFNDLNKEMIASFSQGDRISDKLIIRLTNDKDGPLDLTDVVQVRIDFRKSDGKLVFQYCNIEDRAQGLISCILTTQTLAAPGKVYAEVTAKYPEGKDAVTRQFTFWVQDAIASDKSIESQNEWPMLERAIVAGDMLAGVDLVAIIKAGELAAAALPKTGGTMTGNIDMDVATSNKWYGWKRADGKRHYIFGGTDVVGLFSEANSKTPWRYTPSTDTFDINAANINLVKKAGDAMTGDLLLDYQGTGTRKVSFTQNGVEQLNYYRTGTGFYGMSDVVGAQNVWEYNQTTKSFNINAPVTNVLKTTGGNITGPVNFDAAPTIRGAAATWDMRPYSAGAYSKGVRHTINTANNYYAVAPIDETGAANWVNQIALYGATGKFEVASLATRLDGTTNIALSSEATAPDVNYPLVAVRRNSTVMLKGAVTLNANATGVLVATLPLELRPTTGNLSMYTPTADGTANVQVFVNGSTGAVAVSTNAKGKRVDIVLTYTI